MYFRPHVTVRVQVYYTYYNTDCQKKPAPTVRFPLLFAAPYSLCPLSVNTQPEHIGKCDCAWQCYLDKHMMSIRRGGLCHIRSYLY